MTEVKAMTEERQTCSRCECKYQSYNDFGYTSQGNLYKTCVKCRNRRKVEATQKQITPTITTNDTRLNIYFTVDKRVVNKCIRHKKCGLDKALQQAKEYIEEQKQIHGDKISNDITIRHNENVIGKTATYTVNQECVHICMNKDGKRYTKDIRHKTCGLDEAIEKAEEYIDTQSRADIETNTTIKCSKCKMTYNQHEITQHFEYTDKGTRCQSCVKCQKNTQEKQAERRHKDYVEYGKARRAERISIMRKEAEESNGLIRYCNKCEKNMSCNEFGYSNYHKRLYNYCKDH